MQDRFKFRVWKGQENRMVYDVSYLNPMLLDERLSEEAKHNVVMQCTGLKDKNGKLIYEGDLLRYPAKDSYSERIFMFCEVFWHDNDCCDNHIGWQMNRYHSKGGLMEFNFGTKYKFIPKNTEKMEIIGNIYENKDLLKE